MRETTPATPTRFYAKANFGGTINGKWTYSALAPEVKEKEGHRMVWFGGHSSSRSMTWNTPNGLLSCKRHQSKVRHVFVMRGAWDTWDTIVGAIPSLDSTELHYTQPCPLLAPSKYGTAGGDGTYSTAAVDLYTRNARLYENGVRVDPQATKPCRGMALLDFSTLYEPFSANTFFNDRNLIGSTCTTWGGDRGGGEYIAEAIVFTNALTETQRLQVEGYLMQKWLGTPPVNAVDLRISSEATVEFASSADVSASVTGNGRLMPTSNGDVAFSSKDRTLPDSSLVPGEGAMTLTKTMPLAVSAGDRIDAAFTEDGPRITRSAAEAGAFVKTGPGEVSLGEIGAGVRSFEVQSGRVTVRAKGADVISVREPVPVFIANPSFEDGWTDSQKASGTRWVYGGGSLSGWSVEAGFSNSDGYAYYAPSGKCGPGTAWDLQVQPVDGDCFVLFRSGLKISTPVTIPEDGTYELSFAWSSRPGYEGGQMDAWLVSSDQSATNTFGRVIVVQSSVFRTCRFRRQVSAGSYRLVFSSRTSEDTPVILDDIRLAQVFPVDDGEFPVPGGDFEGAQFASESAMRTLALCSSLDGWTFGEYVGPVTLLANSGNKQVSTGYLYNDSRRGSKGDGFVQLVLADATSVSTTFRPPKGTWQLVAALDYKDENRAWLDATVTRGDSVVSLGRCRPVSHLMEDVTWPVAFEANGTEEVTLTLTLDNSAYRSSFMVFDDVRLVKAARSTAELVKNGSFDTYYREDASDPTQGWCPVKGSFANGSAYLLAYSSGKEYWGYAEYDGTHRLKLCGDAYTHQTVTFPRAGAYRLSFHMSHRCQPDHPDWGDFGHNPVRIWLTRGGAYTNLIATATEYTTNYVQHVYDFSVPEAGDWSFALGGTRVGDYSSLIDGVSIRSLDVAESKLPFESEAEIRVAAGAKLDLGFLGTNEVRRIHLGNRVATGVVNAMTHPDYIQGIGSLYAAPRGGFLIVR